MNTSEPKPDAVKPVLTEAQVLAYMDGKSAEYAPQFPTLRDFRATCGITGQVGFWAYANEQWDSVYAYGATFEEAAVELRKKVPTLEGQAAAKRAEAAKLLSEADALLAKANPVETPPAPAAPAEVAS